MRLTKITALAAVATFAAAVATAPPAQAQAGNGVVDDYEFGLYYYSGSWGPVLDLAASDNNLSNNTFPGYTYIVNNNTMSFRTRISSPVTVYLGAYYTGGSGTIAAANWGGGMRADNFSPNFTNTISSVCFGYQC